MKFVICLVLCAFMASALNPIENLSTALEIFNLSELLTCGEAYDLSASFTYLAGGDSTPEKIHIKGNYNLITFDKDGEAKVKTGSFKNSTDLKADKPVNISGSGIFSSKGHGDKVGVFNGESTTDFELNHHGSELVGSRYHSVFGGYKDGYVKEEGKVAVATWQGRNSSFANVDYQSVGEIKGKRQFSGRTNIEAATTTADSKHYRANVDSDFAGSVDSDAYEVKGTYLLQVYNSKGAQVWDKAGSFDKNGTCDDFATFGINGFDSLSEKISQ